VGPGRFAPGRAAQWRGSARSVGGLREFFLPLIVHGVRARKPILTVRPQLPGGTCSQALFAGRDYPKIRFLQMVIEA
jgi:hypothetical protein